MKDLTMELNPEASSQATANSFSTAMSRTDDDYLEKTEPTAKKTKASRAKGVPKSKTSAAKAKKAPRAEVRASGDKKGKGTKKSKTKNADHEVLGDSETKLETQQEQVEQKIEEQKVIVPIPIPSLQSPEEDERDEPGEINVVEHIEEQIKAVQLSPQREPKVFDEEELGLNAYDVPEIHAKTRQDQILDHVRNQFKVSGSKFHFQEQPAKVAFKDKGSRMVSSSNDERVAKAMAAMAEGKGWKSIKVSGHPDFKRDVWLEANLRGVEVQGFKPTEQDLKLLESRRDRTMHNIVEQVEPKLGQNLSAPVPEETRKEPFKKDEAIETTTEPVSSQSIRPYINMQLAQRKEQLSASSPVIMKDNQQLPEQPRVNPNSRETQAAHHGRVIDHGPARYNNDPKEKLNYFVKLETSSGEKTIWGVDLRRAMSAGNVKVGDQVKLQNKGKEPVVVEALIRDLNGNVIGKEEKNTIRNVWEAERSEKARIVDALGSVFVDAKVKYPDHQKILKSALGDALASREQTLRIPMVPHYDKSAPSKSQQERAVPAVERNAERAR